MQSSSWHRPSIPIRGNRASTPAQAFAEVAGANPDRVELLDPVQHLQHVVEAGIDLGPQPGGDGLEVVAQVAVLVDRIDQRHADALVALAEVAEVQLPKQVVAQGLRARRAFAGAAEIIVARIRCGADPLLPGFAFAIPVLVAAFLGVLAHRRFLDAVGIAHLVGIGRTRLAFLGPVQQRVAGHRLGDFGFQFHGGQLQQPDRLAQLRRQDQLLVQPGGEARLHPCSGYILARAKSVSGARKPVRTWPCPGGQSLNASPR